MWRLILTMVLVCGSSWASDGTSLIDIEGVYKLESMVAFEDGVPSIEEEQGWFVVGRSALFILYSDEEDFDVLKLSIAASDGKGSSFIVLFHETDEEPESRLRARFDVEETNATFTFVGRSDGSEYRTVCTFARLAEVPTLLSERVDSRLKLLTEQADSQKADSEQEEKAARELKVLLKAL